MTAKTFQTEQLGEQMNPVALLLHVGRVPILAFSAAHHPSPKDVSLLT